MIMTVTATAFVNVFVIVASVPVYIAELFDIYCSFVEGTDATIAKGASHGRFSTIQVQISV